MALKHSIHVSIDAMGLPVEKGKIGVYTVGADQKVSFSGNQWQDGKIAARVGSLGSFTLCVDTTAPEIQSMVPADGARLQ